MLPETWTILKLLKWTTAYFKSHDIEQPRVDAEVLLAHTVGVSRLDLYILYDRPLQRNELEAFRGLIQRRVSREPVAYIVGKREFWSIELKVSSDVLIPRPETETLIEEAIRIIPAEPASTRWRILDLGTGSGAIILAIASERPGHRFYGIEQSSGALDMARMNARKHHLDKDITWLQGDWFHVGADDIGRFDVIVSNPPYISSEEFDRLPPEIAMYEPSEALKGGPDGMDAIRRIVSDAPGHMVSGGWLLLEMGHTQWPLVSEMIRSSGDYSEWGVVKDFSGFNRVACARTKGA